MGSCWLTVRQARGTGMEHQRRNQCELVVLVASLFLTVSLIDCQSSRQAFSPQTERQTVLQPSTKGVRQGKRIIIPLPKDASGVDVYPDCQKGKVCLPEADHCAVRKDKGGSLQYQNKTYWVSWHSNEQVLREGKWNWFSGRNYCRKRCMDLISFENEGEWDLFSGFMKRATAINELWTAGRLCDAEVSGCDAPHYQPLKTNGWFWASTLVKMLPTNRPIGLNSDGVRVIGVNEWGPEQPDGFTPPGGLGEEPCMAVKGDGKWHDTSCHDKRPIICEDLPERNIDFVRENNPRVFIP